MTFVADECVLDSIIVRLRSDGHTVHAIRDASGGAPDPDVLAIAVSQQAVLLTQDKDFGELVYRLKMSHCGIVLIRLAGMTSAERADLVSGVIANHASEIPNAFTVISPDNVRIRPAGTPP